MLMLDIIVLGSCTLIACLGITMIVGDVIDAVINWINRRV
jgi:hypothetical protein